MGFTHKTLNESRLEIEHPALGAVRQIATPFRIDAFTPPAVRGPFRGEHTAVVLRDLCGYTEADIAELVRDGIVEDLLLGSRVAT